MACTQILYISDLTDALTLDDLLAIQAVSIRNNARQNITGILLHAGGQFVQLLEGEAGQVRALFERIVQDSRHTNIRLLYELPMDERVFDEWHMAMLDLDLHDAPVRRDLAALVQHAESQGHRPADPQKDLELLHRFRDLLIFA